MRANGLAELVGVKGADRLLRQFANDDQSYQELWQILVSPILTPDEFKTGMRDLLEVDRIDNRDLHRVFWRLYRAEKANQLRHVSLHRFVQRDLKSYDKLDRVLQAVTRAKFGQLALKQEVERRIEESEKQKQLNQKREAEQIAELDEEIHDIRAKRVLIDTIRAHWAEIERERQERLAEQRQLTPQADTEEPVELSLDDGSEEWLLAAQRRRRPGRKPRQPNPSAFLNDKVA